MRRANSGYTLLEILVVLVIISIVAGMAVLTISHNDNKELQAFTRELAQTLTLAEEQALLQPATLGLALSTRNFRFYQQHQENAQASWQQLSDPELGLHKIPAGIELSLLINEKVISLERAATKPNIVVSTNGSLTPFHILIGKKDKTPRYEIIGDADGTVTSRVYKG